MPSYTVQGDDGVGAGCDMAADLAQVQRHGFKVGVWQHQGRADAAREADGTEDKAQP